MKKGGVAQDVWLQLTPHFFLVS